jgi:molecular chaperone HscB
VNLQSNDFELFNLPVTFAQDRAAMDARWKDLQRGAHPDKFAAQGAAAQRIAMQWSVRINEAYQRLKDPVKRAAYLCELHGTLINAETNTAMPAAFLMQQMELREALDDADNEQNLDEISQQSKHLLLNQLSKLEQLIDTDNDYPQAAQAVRALMFMERFSQDIEARYAALG